MASKILFNTPIDENRWIDNWLNENNISIELYNFNNESEYKHKTIEKATSSTRGTDSKSISMEIPVLKKIFYTKTIPIDAEGEIADAILDYENKKKFVAFLKNSKIDYERDTDDNIKVTNKNKQRTIFIPTPEMIPENTVFENEGNLVLSDFFGRYPVKDVTFSAYDLPRTLSNGIIFANEGDIDIEGSKEHDDYIQDMGINVVFKNKGYVQILGLLKIYGNPTFENETWVSLSALEVLSGSPTFKQGDEVYFTKNFDVSIEKFFKDPSKIVIETPIEDSPPIPSSMDDKESDMKTEAEYIAEINKYALSPYTKMDEVFALFSVDVKPVEEIKQRIKDFDGFTFNRMKLILKAHRKNDPEWDEEMKIDFSTTKTSPEEGLRELFDHMEAALMVDGKENKQHKIITSSRDNISLSQVGDFMQIIRPDVKSVDISNLSLIGEYENLYYQTLKFAHDLLVNNSPGFIVGTGFIEVKEKIFTAIGMDPNIPNVLLNTNEKGISSTLEENEEKDLSQSAKIK